MARAWTNFEIRTKRKELLLLYVKENRTIAEVGKILGVAESTVYDRLVRLKIQTLRTKKEGYNNLKRAITIPKRYSAELAEFIGILLGDGHISPTQTFITLGKKEREYGDYIMRLMYELFDVKARRIFSKRGDVIIYIGSTVLVKWLRSMGLACNKVKAQVKVPSWCLRNRQFMKSVARGLLDTDGSVYRLKHGGIQISFTNRSLPLLKSVRTILFKLGFRPSHLSSYKVYLTRAADVSRYYTSIGFKNQKHIKRFLESVGGSYSGNYTRL